MSAIFHSPLWGLALCARAKRYLKGGADCLYACGFRIYFTPLPGFFSPFPHGTGSLSVDYEYLALEDGPPIFRQDFTCPALLVASLVPHPIFAYGAITHYGRPFQSVPLMRVLKLARLLPFRSPLLWESRLISVPAATEMFQFTALASPGLCIQPGIPLRVGFPIQKSSDQCLFAGSPRLIAGCRVFHRL